MVVHTFVPFFTFGCGCLYAIGTRLYSPGHKMGKSHNNEINRRLRAPCSVSALCNVCKHMFMKSFHSRCAVHKNNFQLSNIISSSKIYNVIFSIWKQNLLVSLSVCLFDCLSIWIFVCKKVFVGYKIQTFATQHSALNLFSSNFSHMFSSPNFMLHALCSLN